jgi:hypothetical protein
MGKPFPTLTSFSSTASLPSIIVCGNKSRSGSKVSPQLSDSSSLFFLQDLRFVRLPLAVQSQGLSNKENLIKNQSRTKTDLEGGGEKFILFPLYYYLLLGKLNEKLAWRWAMVRRPDEADNVCLCLCTANLPLLAAIYC